MNSKRSFGKKFYIIKKTSIVLKKAPRHKRPMNAPIMSRRWLPTRKGRDEAADVEHVQVHHDDMVGFELYVQ